MTTLEEAKAYLETMPEVMYGFHAQTLIRALIVEREETCTWTQDEEGVYDTDCGNRFETTEGSPHENQMHWCCFCGKALIEGIT